MPFRSALRKPDSWVPPSGVGIVLQYEDKNPSLSAVHATAHCAAPCTPILPALPVKMSGWTRAAPLIALDKYSLRPSAKWKVAFSGTSSTPPRSSLAHDQRISTPPNKKALERG